MRIKLEQLSHNLQKQLAPLYILFGNEPLLIQEAADLIRLHAHQQGYVERELFTVDQYFDWSALINASHNRSLFGDRRIMDIRIPSGKPGREGGKSIESYCHALPPDTLTLFILPKIDKQGQASKWFKTLESLGTLIPVYAVDREHLPAWITRRLNQQQQKADVAAVQFLTDQVEGNLLAAHQEIQKLALLYPSGHLTFEQVKDVVLNVARYDIFQLSEAMLAGDSARYCRILNGLQGEGVAPLLILATLAEQIRQLIMIRTGLEQGQSSIQLLKNARVWGDRQGIVMAAAKRISSNSLRQGLSDAATIDRIIKGVAQGDVWDALLQLGLSFSSHPYWQSGLLAQGD